MDFAFVPLRPDEDEIYLDNDGRRRISNQAVAVRRLIEDDAVELSRLWQPVIELGQEALYAAAREAGEAEAGPVWQMGAMALTEPGQLGKELGEAKEIIDHWQALGDKVEARRERWLGQEPSERELVHLIFSMVEQAETASWGASPAELARVGGMGMFVAGYLGLRLDRVEAGIAFATFAAMDELELLNEAAGTAAVAALRERGLDVGLGAAMPFLIEDSN
jgi:hypothetical protein